MEYPPLILVLTDRKPSSFVLQGTEHLPEPIRLDVSSNYLLLNESYVLLPPEKKGDKPKQVLARWISGCESIFVEEQKKMGVEYNPIRDMIEFKEGSFTCEREGSTVGLYDFLKCYDGNADNPNRPEGCPIYFREINTKVDAENEISSIPEQMIAISYVNAMMTLTRGAKGVKTFVYDTEKLDWVCKLFNINSIGISDEEKVKELHGKAMADPELFNNIVDDASGDLKVVIKTAKELGIISLDSDTATFVEDNSVIRKLRSKSMNDKIDELANYLKTSEGDMINTVLRTRVDYTKTQMLEQKK